MKKVPDIAENGPAGLHNLNEAAAYLAAKAKTGTPDDVRQAINLILKARKETPSLQ